MHCVKLTYYKILELLEYLVVKYQVKCNKADKPVFICNRFDTRNRYKLDE